MKKILGIGLIAVTLFSFTVIKKKLEVAKTSKVNGIEVYLYSHPNSSYKVLNTVKIDNGNGNPAEVAKNFINAANEISENFDAIVTRGGNLGQVIVFNGKSNSEANLNGYKYKDMYILSKPTKAYTVVKKGKVHILNNDNAREEYFQQIETLRISENLKIDGIITQDGINIEYIKYK